MSPAMASSDLAPATKPAVIPFSTAFSGTGALTPAQKDKVIEWYRGEFAAANAIIDSLCHHLVQLVSNGGTDDNGVSVPAEYEGAFAAIHRRRLNWIPVLQMQKYFTIADVAQELRKAAEKRREKVVEEVVEVERREKMVEKSDEDLKMVVEDDENMKCNGSSVNGGCVSEGEDSSPNSEITDTGSHEVQANLDHIEICDNHEDCLNRREQIKMTKGFVAKEPVKGHMVNVVKGLKMYEDIFTESELSKLNDFVDELRAAGQNGDLLGETYILFNKQIKANKREQIQLGVPIFGHVKDEALSQEQKTHIEDIPALLQSVIDHLVEWHILPENRKPNGCIINYFDEGEYSQPFLKPPHLDQPICNLVLSESTMAFGRTVVNDGEGNFKGQLMLSMKEGSLLVMRNNSADMARHVMCASPTRRVSITFSRVRPDNVHHNHHSAAQLAPLSQAMTMWQPNGVPTSPTTPNGTPMDVVPKWGVIRAPLVMLAPVRPVVMNHPRRMPRGGTGVFLPWAVGSRKPAKHLPPRAQKGRFLALPPVETQVSDTMSDPGVEGGTM